MSRRSARQQITSTATPLGLEAIRNLSQLGTERNVPNFRVLAKGIDMSAVDSARRLSLDPETIHHLTKNGPAIMKGCVRFMRAAITGEVAATSTLSPECGYACFRLLVATLNLCLLDRCNKLDEALSKHNTLKNSNFHAVVSFTFQEAMEKQAKVLNAGGDCNWIFGWSTSTRGNRQTPLLSQSEVRSLLNLLWDFRGSFFKSILSASPPPLTGLILLFVRSVSEQHSLSSPNLLESELLKCKLHELALRYMLLTNEIEHWTQHQAMAEILALIESDDGLWSRDPKHTDVEDSRRILRSFINVLANYKKGGFPLNTPYVLYRLAVLAVDVDSQDLLPEIMGRTIDFMWHMIQWTIDNGGDITQIVLAFFSSLGMFLIPPHDSPFELTEATQVQIIAALHRADFLSLIARVIASLEPGRRKSSPQFDKHCGTLQSMLRFVSTLVEFIPEEAVESCFEDYIHDWWKFEQFLRVNACGVTGNQLLVEARRQHYEQCREIWSYIAYGVGLERAIDAHRDPRLCSNPRCPTLHTYDHVHHSSEFECAGCNEGQVYCDRRCQTIGWQGIDGHRELCTTPKEVPALE